MLFLGKAMNVPYISENVFKYVPVHKQFLFIYKQKMGYNFLSIIFLHDFIISTENSGKCS
jgi:hypothetical protein